jgi:uncharacterized protein
MKSARWKRPRRAAASLWDYMLWNWGVYSTLIGEGLLLFTVIEATSTMFVGMALFKLGIMQGERSTRFYVAMLVACYGFGLTARYVGVHERLAFDLAPKTAWALEEYARLAVTAGTSPRSTWRSAPRAGGRSWPRSRLPGSSP